MTEKWLEVTVRFLCPDHGIRKIKDAMNRQIVAGLNDAKIEIASATYGSSNTNSASKARRAA